MLEWCECKKGNVLFYEGDISEHFFIVLNGKVNIYLPKNIELLKQ